MVILTKTLLKSTEELEEKKKEEEWSRIIRNQDGWACLICGNPYKPNAHHLIPREIKEFKFDLDNGITLCWKHHKTCRQISAHNNPLAFFWWVEKYIPFKLEIMKNKYKNYLKNKENIEI